MMQEPIPVIQRVMHRVCLEDRGHSSPCWIWQGYRNADGYGTISSNGTKVKTHRVTYSHHVGPIPEGLQIDHLCRVRECCNPTHLEAVTSRENIRRGETGAVGAAKTHCPHGHPYAGDNLYVVIYGGRTHRRCRACKRVRDAAYKLKKKRERLYGERLFGGRHENYCAIGRARYYGLHDLETT